MESSAPPCFQNENGNAGQRIVLAMPGNHASAAKLADALGARMGQADIERFPDGESRVRLRTPVSGAEVVMVCTLDRPDEKVLPLLWLAIAVREAGAGRAGLVAPYLAYMRQDAIFQSGEIRAAEHFAAMLSRYVDWVVAVEPHLHRIPALSDLFSVPSAAVPTAPSIAAWLRANVRAPYLIGPDEESRRQVQAVAALCGADWTVLKKTRRTAWDVDVAAMDAAPAAGCTPVLVDDIASTGRTLIAAAGQIRAAGLPKPLCVVAHPIFAGPAYAELAAHVADVVTCDTIAHPSNRIAVTEPMARAVRSMFDLPRPRAEPGLVRS
ncbi:ribose-phosphate pyrophosphokinase [Ralstonia solanacearum]|uniref:ribose-phosphate diphosphokinase n=1 Tax=Ralstonia solanacearum CFBP2957 TaxID=859656 RepID=D8P4F3_RALSL|nr:ribose-phosphate pyrophosphokinase [Ralstonia solanacearum]CBJ53789.1 putative ribose-phosphate pyrophosphokinase protein (prsA) [Ralstonia solanacearum CFBP2957]